MIPKLQLKRRRIGTKDVDVLVTTVGFDETIDVGDPISQARIFESLSADELIFLDLDATRENRGPNLDVIVRAAERIFMPFTVGGGVRNVDDFKSLLDHGADKVSVNTAAIARPELIAEASRRFGAQCVVVSMDAKREPDGTYRIWTGTPLRRTDWQPAEWARRAESLGAGEILITSIDRDGGNLGLDVELVRQVTTAVTVPVIASGGCGLAKHFVEGFREGGADAVAAGTFFCFRDQNPMQTRAQIRNAQIPIRIPR